MVIKLLNSSIQSNGGLHFAKSPGTSDIQGPHDLRAWNQIENITNFSRTS